MSLTINGTIKKILELEQGTSKSGKEWQKQNVIIEQNIDSKKEEGIRLPELVLDNI